MLIYSKCGSHYASHTNPPIIVRCVARLDIILRCRAPIGAHTVLISSATNACSASNALIDATVRPVYIDFLLHHPLHSAFFLFLRATFPLHLKKKKG